MYYSRLAIQLIGAQASDGAKNVPVGTPIAIVGEPGDDLSGADALASEAPAEKKESKPEPSGEKKQDAPKPPPQPSFTEPGSTSSPPAPETKAADLEFSKDKIFASPIAKKLALERGIPLSKVKGSGPEGRILRSDIEAYKPSAASSATAPAPAQAGPEYTDTPVSNMRKTIGQRLTQSKQELPHYYLTVDIDMGKVLKLREVFNKDLAEKGAKLSVNDFIVKASSLALADVPEANSAWLGDVIRQ